MNVDGKHEVQVENENFLSRFNHKRYQEYLTAIMSFFTSFGVLSVMLLPGQVERGRSNLRE
jgi:hypothetical protein